MEYSLLLYNMLDDEIHQNHCKPRVVSIVLLPHSCRRQKWFDQPLAPRRCHCRRALHLSNVKINLIFLLLVLLVHNPYRYKRKTKLLTPPVHLDTLLQHNHFRRLPTNIHGHFPKQGTCMYSICLLSQMLKFISEMINTTHLKCSLYYSLPHIFTCM